MSFLNTPGIQEVIVYTSIVLAAFSVIRPIFRKNSVTSPAGGCDGKCGNCPLKKDSSCH